MADSRGYSGSKILKDLTLDFPGDSTTLILGFPYVIQRGRNQKKDTAYTDFSAFMVDRVKKFKGNGVSAEFALRKFFKEAVKENNWNFEVGPTHDGYFYPIPNQDENSGRSTVKRKLAILEEAMTSKELITFNYPSKKVVNSETSIVIERMYLGRVSRVDAGKGNVNLKLNEKEVKTFKIDDIMNLGSFADPLAEGEILHLELKFSSERGRTKFSWRTISGEDPELLAQPVLEKVASIPEEEEETPPEAKPSVKAAPPESTPQEKEKAPETSVKEELPENFREFLIEKGGLVDWSALEKHLGKYIRVDICIQDTPRETACFRLESFNYDHNQKYMELRGRNFSIHEPLINLVISGAER